MDRNLASVSRCDNCGAEIPWAPVMHRDRTYCCGGCAQGGPCYCSYDLATRDWLRPSTQRRQAADANGRDTAGTGPRTNASTGGR